MEDDEGDGHDVFLAIVGGRFPPADLVDQRPTRVTEGGSYFADLVFELPLGVDPEELRYRVGERDLESRAPGRDTVVFEFR